MTWHSVLTATGGFLAEKAVPDPEVVAELLAARLLGVGRGMLAAHLEHEVSPRHLEAMRRAMRRLAAGEPVQYVLGEWDFRYLTLKCDRRALIPRPETEGLVSLVLDALKRRRQASPPVIVDVGTGTGAIVLSLAKEFTGDATFIGLDISADALSLARENAVLCKLDQRVQFAIADGLDFFDDAECIDFIVSNPPYIATDEISGLDPRVRDFEPYIALNGGKTGLDFYERYLEDALNLLKPGGGVFFEIGNTQGEAVADLMRNYGFEDVRIRRDLAGLDRYASAILSV